MTKYKVGDRVIVREDLSNRKKYKMQDVKDSVILLATTHMVRHYSGKEVTIKDTHVSIWDEKTITYKIEEDGGGYEWTDEMFKGLATPLHEREDIDIGNSAKLEIYVEKAIVSDPAVVLFYRVSIYNKMGYFDHWSDTRKIVAKCNKDAGDVFDRDTGIQVAILKAYRKEIDRMLRKI